MKERLLSIVRRPAARVVAAVGAGVAIASTASAQFSYTPADTTDLETLTTGMIGDGIALVLSLWVIAMPLLLLYIGVRWIWNRIG